MSHFVRTQVDGVWINGFAPSASDFGDIDYKIVRAINGDDGGAWGPSSQILFDAGFFRLTGPLVVSGVGGATASLKTLSGGRFKLGDGDWPQFPATHPARTRRIMTPCMIGTTSPGPGTQGYSSIPRFDLCARQTTAQGFLPVVSGPMDPKLMIANTPMTIYGAVGSGTVLPVVLSVPLRVHNGATLFSATVTFRVSFDHTTYPTAPKMRIVRVDKNGVKTPLTSVAGGALDANGFVLYPMPTPTPAWYDSGNVKSMTIVCDVANVVDITLYTYLAEIVEESGNAPTVLPIIKAPVAAASTGDCDVFNCPATINGVSTTPSGTRFLLWQQADPTQNGTYVAIGGSGGIMIRDLDSWGSVAGCNSQKGSMVFSGTLGTLYNRQWFQQISDTLAAPAGAGTQSALAAVTYVQFGQPGTIAVGNIWHAVSCLFTNIADGRFQ